jgi:hypothetical protein
LPGTDKPSWIKLSERLAIASLPRPIFHQHDPRCDLLAAGEGLCQHSVEHSSYTPQLYGRIKMSPSDSEILKKYTQQLQHYANKVMPHFPKYLENQRKPFNPFFKKVFDLYLFSSFLVDSHLFPDDEEITGLRILYAKASLSLFGILTCLENGLVSEGAVLLRSLFEALLNVNLILEKDTDERLKLFYDYRYVDRWNNIRANKRLLSEGKTTQETFDKTFTSAQLKETEENYSRVRSNYHPSRPYHWAWRIYSNETKGENPSINFIADKLNLAEDYVKVYSSLSISVHNSPNLVNIMQTRKGISLAPNFQKTIYLVGCLAVRYMAEIIESVTRSFKFNDAETHAYVSAFLLAIYEEYKEEGS